MPIIMSVVLSAMLVPRLYGRKSTAGRKSHDDRGTANANMAHNARRRNLYASGLPSALHATWQFHATKANSTKFLRNVGNGGRLTSSPKHPHVSIAPSGSMAMAAVNTVKHNMSSNADILVTRTQSRHTRQSPSNISNELTATHVACTMPAIPESPKASTIAAVRSPQPYTSMPFNQPERMNIQPTNCLNIIIIA